MAANPRLTGSGKATAAGASPFTWDTSAALPQLLSDGTFAFVYGPGGLPIEQIDRMIRTNSSSVTRTGWTVESWP